MREQVLWDTLLWAIGNNGNGNWKQKMANGNVKT